MDDHSGFNAPRDQAPFAANDVRRAAKPGPFGHPNPDPGPEYRRNVTQDIKDGFVGALQRAYSVVQEAHDDALGWDAHTFGYCVYRVGLHWLKKYCEASGGKLELVDELKTLSRFRCGEYTFGFYKVGSSITDNIWEALPTSENGGFTIDYDEGQPFLAGLEDFMVDRVDMLRYSVIAHLGNPKDGLCAIYLCIPVQAEGGKIKRWGYAEPIYLRSMGKSGAPPPPVGGPPPEVPPQPIAPEEEPDGEVVVTAR
jgi:hypothetical protein